MSHLNKILLLLITLLLLSCSIDQVSTEVESGSLSFTIPSISPLVEEELKVDEKENRAFIRSSSVRVTIYDDQDALVKTQDYESGSAVNVVLSPGSYTLKLEIFNSYISSDYPVVEGVSDSFEIVSGEVTSTHIMLTPSNPVVLEESISQTVSVTDYGRYSAQWDYFDSFKSEYWFSFTTVSNITLIESSMNTENIKSSLLYIYDSTGAFVTKSSNKSDVILETTIGETYYIAVLPFLIDYNGEYDYPEVVSVSWQEYVVEDSDNSIATATELTSNGENVTHMLHDDDSDFFSLAVEAGTYYSMNTVSQGDLSLIIYNSNSEVLETVSLSGNSYLFNHDVDETLYFEISDNVSGLNAYSISVSTQVIESIVLSDEWLELNIPYNESNYYSLPVTPGSSYTVSWDDSHNGTDSYLADVWVSVFDFYGDIYFSKVDSGYDSPSTITVGDNISEIIIEINGDWGGGTVGLLVQEVVPEV